MQVYSKWPKNLLQTLVNESYCWLSIVKYHYWVFIVDHLMSIFNCRPFIVELLLSPLCCWLFVVDPFLLTLYCRLYIFQSLLSNIWLMLNLIVESLFSTLYCRLVLLTLIVNYFCWPSTLYCMSYLTVDFYRWLFMVYSFVYYFL